MSGRVIDCEKLKSWIQNNWRLDTDEGPLERSVDALALLAAIEVGRLDAQSLTPPLGVDGLLPCPFCGGAPEFWEGLGTQADLTCSDCGIPCVGVQVCDVMTREERHSPENAFNMDTLKYPDWVIEKTNAELKEMWNTRTPTDWVACSEDSISLTGKEIFDLAEFAGFEVKCDDPFHYEVDYVVTDCPPEGIENDDGQREHWHRIAYIGDYPEEGGCPLGEKLPQPPGRRDE